MYVCLCNIHTIYTYIHTRTCIHTHALRSTGAHQLFTQRNWHFFCLQSRMTNAQENGDMARRAGEDAERAAIDKVVRVSARVPMLKLWIWCFDIWVHDYMHITNMVHWDMAGQRQTDTTFSACSVRFYACEDLQAFIHIRVRVHTHTSHINSLSPSLSRTHTHTHTHTHTSSVSHLHRWSASGQRGTSLKRRTLSLSLSLSLSHTHKLLEDITTEPHAHDISADIVRVWLSGDILKHK